jgi:hypothetical protein
LVDGGLKVHLKNLTILLHLLELHILILDREANNNAITGDIRQVCDVSDSECFVLVDNLKHSIACLQAFTHYRIVLGELDVIEDEASERLVDTLSRIHDLSHGP